MLTNEIIEKIVKNKLPENLQEDIYTNIVETIDQIQLVNNLLNPDRLKAKNLKKDNKGRVIVDLTNPHILEDTDYFRPLAIYFQKYGTYTHLFPNPAPNSDYRRFWDEQKKRCIEGYVRESDGEWISGYYYFYLNFSPILRTKIVKDNQSSSEAIRSERIYDFPDFWDGDYLFYHYVEQAERDGEYGNILKTRSRGFSFKSGSMFARNYYFFHKSRSLAAASETEFLIKDGVLNKAWDVLDWVDENTPFTKAREKKDQDMHKRSSYVDPVDKIEKGFKSEIIGVTLKDNPNKMRGKRAKLIVYEESGVFPQLTTAWSIARMSLEDGRRVFGFMLAQGTGGTTGANFDSALKFFYNPDGYRIKKLKNIYDKTRGQGECSFFFPEYINRADCYDKDGNSDILKALLEIFKDRQKIKDGTTDPHALTQEKADRPITPEEAVMRKEGTLFPVSDLKEARAVIIPQLDKFVAGHYIGNLVMTDDGNVKWIPDQSIRIIREFPIRDTMNKIGGLEIFELPNEYKPWGRYIAGIDPIDDDHSTTNSLYSIFMFDTFTDRIVAEYTGRPMFANDAYELTLRLLKYYNAQGNYENDKKGLFAYFSQKGALHYLCDNPRILKDMDMIRGETYGNKAHSYDQHVYTPKGLKKWEDIQIGNYLFGTNRNIVKVIDIPFDEETKIYKITLQDNRTIEASENHLWDVIDWNDKSKTLTTKQIEDYYFRDKGKYKEYKYYIINHKGVNYRSRKFIIDPYLLGLLLGDGCFTQSTMNNACFASTIDDMKNYVKIIKYDYATNDTRHHRIRIPRIKQELIKLNLHDKKSRTKFIPDLYKYNSFNNRLEILKGLMDTDGAVGGDGNPQYTTVSKQLALDVKELSYSLGINCNLNITQNKFGYVYTIRFYTEQVLFKLERKSKKQRVTKNRAFRTAITNIEYIGIKKAKCVTVDSSDNCYLIGDYVKTHNSKGTPSGKRTNQWGRRLQRDWMLSVAFGCNDTGVMNLQRIRSLGYIEEAIEWNADANFDRISAMNMCMILREQIRKYSDSLKETDVKEEKSFSSDLKKMLLQNISYNQGKLTRRMN